jgi:hypothetical protein
MVILSDEGRCEAAPVVDGQIVSELLQSREGPESTHAIIQFDSKMNIIYERLK